MKKKIIARKPYLAPCAEVCNLRIESPMLGQSPFVGGHNSAGDDEPLTAKPHDFSDADRAGQDGYGPWED